MISVLQQKQQPRKKQLKKQWKNQNNLWIFKEAYVTYII